MMGSNKFFLKGRAYVNKVEGDIIMLVVYAYSASSHVKNVMELNTIRALNVTRNKIYKLGNAYVKNMEHIMMVMIACHAIIIHA